jgi:hypothetical protein
VMTKKIILIILVVAIVLNATDVFAQGCPMCKTSLEEARKNGSMVGNTLNNGILYLLALPYLVLSTFGIIWYRNTKLKKQQSNN